MMRMYLIIGTGFFLTKKGLLGVTTARACSDMVLLLFMPSLVFQRVVAFLDLSDIKTIGVICFCAFIMYSINTIIAFLIVKFTPIPKNPKDRWVGGAILAGIMQNVSDLPIAYIQGLSVFSLKQQNKGTAYVIIWLAMYIVVQFNCGLFQLVEWDFEYAEKHSHQDTEKHATGQDHSDDQHEIQYDGQDEDDQKAKIDALDDNDEDESTSHSYASESPMSATSSILSGTSIPNMQKQHSRKYSHQQLDPKPLTLINSKLSELTRSTTHTNAISRIPSARNNYDDDQLSLNQELIKEYSRVEPYNQKISKTMKIVTETNITGNDVKTSGDSISFVKKYKLHYFVFFLQNLKKPNSIALMISIFIALIPWLKALFVNTGKVQLPNAPDKEPALSFILMYAEYLGYPCVPMGLLLIGSSLARLEIKDIPNGFWKSALCNTIFRLAILPIIGTAFITRLKNIGWLTDPMAVFVCILEFALPSATVQLYLTAGAMKPGDTTCAPLNCFGLYLILQYITLVISMPIVVTYCIKKTIDM